MSLQEVPRPSGENYSVDVVMATKYGIEEAFLIRHLQFWIRFNKNKQANLIEGRTWTYQTLKEIADHFPFLNERKIKYAMENLEKMEVILKGNFNKSAMDKTCWYAFVNEEIYVPSLSEDSKKSYERQNCLSTDKIVSSMDKIVPPIPDTKPDSKPSNNPPSLNSSILEDPQPDKKGEGGKGIENDEWVFLQSVAIDAKDKERIKRDYAPEFSKKVIEYVTTPGFFINKTLDRAIFHFLRNPDQMKQEQEKAKEESNMSNEDLEIALRKRGEQYCKECPVTDSTPTCTFHYIEFRHSGKKINFNDANFKRLCQEQIKSYQDYCKEYTRKCQKQMGKP